MKLHNRALFHRRPGCVLIDLDDTLYPYAPSHAAGMAAAARTARRLLDLDEAAFLTAVETARTAVKARLGDQAASHSRLLYFQAALEQRGLASQPFAALQLEQAYWRAFIDAAELFDDALAFLDDLRIAGVPAAVVTDLTSQVQLRKMVALGLDRLIDWVVTSEESGHDKPHRASFDLAMAKLGAADGPVWMVGDNHHCDLSGAKAALGAVTLHKTHAGVAAPPAGCGHVDAAFKDFSALRRLLASLA